MIHAKNIVYAADAYAVAAGDLPDSIVSRRVFDDGNRLAKMRDGAEITVGRFNRALQWFVDNWPEGSEVPDWITTYIAAEVVDDG